MPAFDLKLEPLCDLEVSVEEPIFLGPSSWGTRVILPLAADGIVRGPRLNGRIRQFGGDWGLVRADNCFELDVRIVIDTDDGALIYSEYRGVVSMTQEQVEQSLGGELVPGLSIYVTPRFETSHQDYQWLTRIQAVGRGTARMDGNAMKVAYSWYELTA
jgi:hypothetical protein